MDPVELRPLSLGELLDRTFTLYRAHFWLFAGIMAIPSTFSVPLNVIIFSARGGSLLPANPSPAFSGRDLSLVIGLGILLVLVYALAMGAATFAVSESYLGHNATVRGSYARVGGSFWRIIGVALNVALRSIGIMVLTFMAVVGVTMGGTVLLSPVLRTQGRGTAATAAIAIVVGLIVVLAYLAAFAFSFVLTLRYAVTIPALLLESLGVLAAIRRSVHLTRGRRWHILLAVMLASIISYVGVIIFQGPFLAAMMFSATSGPIPAWLALASAAAAAVGGIITGPLLMIVLVLCYYDSRIRKEAFDLQFMISSLDQPAAAASTATPA